MESKGKLRMCCVLAGLMLLTACAGVQPAGRGPESTSSQKALRQRAETYWQNKIKLKLEKTYPLETPEFRKRFSIVDYSRHYGGEVVFHGAEVKSVEIDGKNAMVNVRVRYSFFGLYSPKGGAPATLRDYWTLVDGKWYHLINAPGTKFDSTRKR